MFPGSHTSGCRFACAASAMDRIIPFPRFPNGSTLKITGRGTSTKGDISRRNPAGCVEFQVVLFSSHIDAGADVFAAVNAVAGGPDDFRHVRPHGVKPRTAERTAISGAGHRDLAGLGLKPGVVDDIRFPVGIAHPEKLRVDRLGEHAAGTILNATETILALVIDGIHQGLRVVGAILIHVIEAALFDTGRAFQAVLFKIDDSRPADGNKVRRSRGRFDMIFFGHSVYLHEPISGLLRPLPEARRQRMFHRRGRY